MAQVSGGTGTGSAQEPSNATRRPPSGRRRTRRPGPGL